MTREDSRAGPLSSIAGNTRRTSTTARISVTSASVTANIPWTQGRSVLAASAAAGNAVSCRSSTEHTVGNKTTRQPPAPRKECHDPMRGDLWLEVFGGAEPAAPPADEGDGAGVTAKTRPAKKATTGAPRQGYVRRDRESASAPAPKAVKPFRANTKKPSTEAATSWTTATSTQPFSDEFVHFGDSCTDHAGRPSHQQPKARNRTDNQNNTTTKS